MTGGKLVAFVDDFRFGRWISGLSALLAAE